MRSKTYESIYMSLIIAQTVYSRERKTMITRERKKKPSNHWRWKKKKKFRRVAYREVIFGQLAFSITFLSVYLSLRVCLSLYLFRVAPVTLPCHGNSTNATLYIDAFLELVLIGVKTDRGGRCPLWWVASTVTLLHSLFTSLFFIFLVHFFFF